MQQGRRIARVCRDLSGRLQLKKANSKHHGDHLAWPGADCAVIPRQAQRAHPSPVHHSHPSAVICMQKRQPLRTAIDHLALVSGRSLLYWFDCSDALRFTSLRSTPSAERCLRQSLTNPTRTRSRSRCSSPKAAKSPTRYRFGLFAGCWKYLLFRRRQVGATAVRHFRRHAVSGCRGPCKKRWRTKTGIPTY